MDTHINVETHRYQPIHSHSTHTHTCTPTLTVVAETTLAVEAETTLEVVAISINSKQFANAPSTTTHHEKLIHCY